MTPMRKLFERLTRQAPEQPREMSAKDFKVPLRHALALWFEKWGPFVVMGLAGLALLAGVWWLRRHQ